MKFQFIDNACSIIEYDRYRILTDPWLTDGAFEGSWYHYPPIKTKPEDLVGVDAIYISHLHPDHYDPASLIPFPKDVPIIVLDHGANFLHRLLNTLGFTNLVPIKDSETKKVGPLELTMYGPFAPDIFHRAEIGNIIDSSVVVEAGKRSLFNGNDNNPSLDGARRLRDRHGGFTLALVKYNAASPFPTCFMNFSEIDRLKEADRIRNRNLEYLTELTEILAPEFLMPFAGSFVLAGGQAKKNQCLGTCSWDRAAEYVANKLPKQKTLVMSEGQVFDFESKSITNGAYVQPDWAGQNEYVEQNLLDIPYPFESDPMSECTTFLRTNLPLARSQLWDIQTKNNWTLDYNIYLSFQQDTYEFSFSKPEGRLVGDSPTYTPPYLRCEMDPRLLKRILQGDAHWNNAEIGCHIDFFREPNIYYPDVHVMLCFLKLPRSAKNATTAKR